jgi:Predicted solute binding protein
MAQMKPWWKFWEESTPTQKIKASLETPAVGGAGAVTKTVYKVGGAASALLFGGAGILLGTLLGGKSQEVKPTQKTRTDPKQLTEQQQRQLAQQRGMARLENIMQRLYQKTTVTPTVTPTVGGAQISNITGSTVTYAPYTLTETITSTGVSAEQFSGYLQMLAQIQSQQATPTQTVTVTPTQETTATQLDMTSLLILAAIAAGAFILTRK